VVTAVAFDLQRFEEAQDEDYAAALAELREGRKRTHWIWYVFPQLRGLGSSPAAVRYGLDGREEAEAYLRDRVLRDRLIEATSAVHHHVFGRGASIASVMGSHVDALKLVSSLTLFEQVAARVDEPGLERLRALAAEILDRAAAEGYPRCRFTLAKV
jgi:uncharacterized protein (DUF1810 family)